MREEITQNGKVVLWSETGGLLMIWNNITGKNMDAGHHRVYMESMVYNNGFRPGRIEFHRNGQMVDHYTIE